MYLPRPSVDYDKNRDVPGAKKQILAVHYSIKCGARPRRGHFQIWFSPVAASPDVQFVNNGTARHQLLPCDNFFPRVSLPSLIQEDSIVFSTITIAMCNHGARNKTMVFYFIFKELQTRPFQPPSIPHLWRNGTKCVKRLLKPLNSAWGVVPQRREYSQPFLRNNSC